MHGYYGYGFPGGAGVAGFVGGFPWMAIVSWVIGIAIVAAIIYFAVKSGRQAPRRNGEALDILARRYAKGEINKEEYLEAQDFLKKN
jgi:putative membrane protein